MSEKKQTLPQLFLKLAQPDEDGFSRKVSIEDFKGEYKRLELGNGGSWCRDDGSLARIYNIKRHKERGKIIAVSLEGFKKNVIDKAIRADIRKDILKEKCVILYTSKVEVDHKDGRRDDPRVLNTATQTLKDFQPLSKAANNAKRQHCKKCRQTGIRFDAKRLGYTKSYTKGSAEYNGTCIGCYWYDPFAFNQQISKIDPNE